MEQDIQWYKINLLLNEIHATSLTFSDPALACNIASAVKPLLLCRYLHVIDIA